MRYSIGVDLGGTKIATGLVNGEGKIIKKLTLPTKAHRSPEEIADDIALLIKQLIDSSSLVPDDIEFCGIATPGIANSDTGRVDFCSSLPFLHFPLLDILRSKVPVKKYGIENDANAAAKGEHIFGAAKGAKDSVMITLGTGVGGGIIIDNKIVTGCNFAAGELGHIVIQHNGRQCGCGRRGCWETYSSATGLINTTKEKMQKYPDSLMWKLVGGDIEATNGRTSFDAMRKGDKAASEVVDMFIDYLACGITNIINIFQPEVLSIGGGLSNEGDYILNPLLIPVSAHQYSRGSEKRTDIRIAKLGNEAGIIGAAFLDK
ncbi:MAG: ROK family protein [Oscillospiraceae bacterium]|nr:ROK family protein [Oscillospiraceae bacterium]